MNDEVASKKQSAFSFDQEIPSLSEPFQQKEKELGDSSPDLIPLKMQMIDAFIEQGNHYQAYKDFMSLIDMIYSTDSSICRLRKTLKNFVTKRLLSIKTFLAQKSLLDWRRFSF